MQGFDMVGLKWQCFKKFLHLNSLTLYFYLYYIAHIKSHYSSLEQELLEDRSFVIILLIKGKPVQLATRM